MASTAVPNVPNPNTPLAFLPPILAEQFQVSIYVVVGGFSAFVWDWIMSLPEEYKMLRNTRFKGSDVTYVLSRFATLGFGVSATLFQVSSVGHCQTLLYITGSFVGLSISSTSFLFLYRVRAVYSDSKTITGFFSFLWVAMLGSYVLVPLSLEGDYLTCISATCLQHIGPTNRCINTGIHAFGFVPIVINAVNDTLIFVAISYKILTDTTLGDTWRARARSFYAANGLPRLSKALLQGGQLYYFATIGLSVVFAVMLVAPNMPAVYRTMLSVPNLGLENAMACRVYRAVKLGFIKDYRSARKTSPRFSTVRDTGPEFAFTIPTLNESHNFQVNLNITTTADSNIRTDPVSGKPSLAVETSDTHRVVSRHTEMNVVTLSQNL